MIEKQNELSNVKKVIGVVSGKGGVGKSMVTSMLAVTMARRGFKVGILDADITGPSIPKMFGVHDRARGDEFGIYPCVSKEGVQMMSMNLLLENEDDPVVWRGALISGTVLQFWTDVIWQGVDFMFVDMPPGTGDVPLTLFQSIPLDGIIVVTTPQDLVGMIVSKAINMAQMMNVPILGIVENMSYLTCPDCGRKISVFGESVVDSIALEHNIPAVVKVPIDRELTLAADSGKIEEVENNYLSDFFDKIVAELKDKPLATLRQNSSKK